jgi:hypothetical protein
MNLTRGFFRIWIVLSALWILGFGYFWLDEYSKCCKPVFDPAEFKARAAAKPPFDPSKRYEVVPDAKPAITFGDLPDAPWVKAPGTNPPPVLADDPDPADWRQHRYALDPDGKVKRVFEPPAPSGNVFDQFDTPTPKPPPGMFDDLIPTVYARDLILPGILVFAVPLATLIFDLTLMWIARGFRRSAP